MIVASIPENMLRLSAKSAGMRRANNGQTAQLAVYARRAAHFVGCHHGQPVSRSQADMLRHVVFVTMTTVIGRGYINNVINRTRNLHGLGEVRKTWGQGINALLAEPPFLHAGQQ